MEHNWDLNIEKDTRSWRTSRIERTLGSGDNLLVDYGISWFLEYGADLDYESKDS